MFTDVDLSDEKAMSNNQKNTTDAEDHNDDATSNGKKSFWQTRVIIPFKRNPLKFLSIAFISLSTLLLFILLVGGKSRSVYLSKFSFKEPIKFITNKSELTFTLYGHCVDDQCTKPEMVHNFDKMPSASEITSSSSGNKKKRIDVGGIANNAGQTIGNTANNAGQTIGNTANNAGQNIGNAAGDAGQTIGNAAGDAGQAIGEVGSKAGDIAEDVIKAAPGLLKALLGAFENFKPKNPTSHFSGLISVPYVIAILCNIGSLVLLFLHLPILAALFLLIAAFFNILALIFDMLVFVWVFQLVSVIPGVGTQHTGPGIHLAIWSAIFLVIATILMCCGCCGSAFKGAKKTINKAKKSKISEQEKQRQIMDRV